MLNLYLVLIPTENKSLVSSRFNIFNLIFLSKFICKSSNSYVNFLNCKISTSNYKNLPLSLNQYFIKSKVQ